MKTKIAIIINLLCLLAAIIWYLNPKYFKLDFEFEPFILIFTFSGTLISLLFFSNTSTNSSNKLKVKGKNNTLIQVNNKSNKSNNSNTNTSDIDGEGNNVLQSN